MYSPEEREQIQDALLLSAQNDQRLGGGAITGSASLGLQDRWSDIDLAFGVLNKEDVIPVLGDYTQKMYSNHGALHHLDVWSGSWIYRVFFLKSTLQVDLAFVHQDEFGARAPTFKQVFGSTNNLPQKPPQSTASLIGWAWLYALHSRSSLLRGHVWQAEHMIGKMREQVLALCCRRHGLPEKEGRGVDRLPSEVLHPMQETLVGSLQIKALWRSFEALLGIFVGEIQEADPALAKRLGPSLTELAADY